jgi:hypothetical protein
MELLLLACCRRCCLASTELAVALAFLLFDEAFLLAELEGRTGK